MTPSPFRLAGLLAVAVATLTLAGCGASPESRRFLLTPAASAPAPAAASGPVVLVSEATVAPYFDRSQMVRRAGDYRVEFDEFDVWAEPIGQLVTRKLVDDLAARYGRARVLTARSGRALEADVTVGADVLRFDSDGQGAVTAEVRWSVASEARGCLVATDRSRVVRSHPDPASTDQRVAAFSDALSEVSAQIAEAIETARARPASPCL